MSQPSECSCLCLSLTAIPIYPKNNNGEAKPAGEIISKLHIVHFVFVWILALFQLINWNAAVIKILKTNINMKGKTTGFDFFLSWNFFRTW